MVEENFEIQSFKVLLDGSGVRSFLPLLKNENFDIQSFQVL